MRKILLVLGGFYLITAVYMLFLLQKMVPLYRDFDTDIPVLALVSLGYVLFYGMSAFVVSFSEKRSKWLVNFLVIVGVGGILVYSLFYSYQRYRANQMLRQILLKTNLPVNLDR